MHNIKNTNVDMQLKFKEERGKEEMGEDL